MGATSFTNSKDLAQKIHGTLKTKYKKYTLRPWNRFEVEKTMYWIIPSTEYRAYKYGKYIVFQDNKEDCYAVGLHIEKGCEKSIDGNVDLLISSDWAWHMFIESLSKGEVEGTLLKIGEDVNEKVNVEVSVEVSEINLNRMLRLSDECFIDAETKEKVELCSLKTWIENIKGIEWYWVDLYVIYKFNRNIFEKDKEFGDYYIVNRLLEPLEKWVR
jgi:hypothetical protein